MNLNRIFLKVFFNNRIALIFWILVAVSATINGQTAPEGVIEVIQWPRLNQILSTYILDQSLAIVNDSHKLSLAMDVTISGLRKQPAENINFLPTRLDETLPNLIAINFWNCSISRLSGESFKSLKLQEIQIVNCKISSITLDAFSEQSQLVILDLAGNSIERIEQDMFRDLSNLLVLNLAANNIASVGNSLHYLIDLQDINLSANLNLQVFNGDEFASNTKLKNIWMFLNNIRKLNNSLFDDKMNLQQVDLRHNQCINNRYNRANFSDMYESINKNCPPRGIIKAVGDTISGFFNKLGK